MGKKTMTEIRESGIIMGRGLEHMELTGIPLCTKCLKPYVQVADYEFKPVCKCHPENWRLMVGGKMSEKKTWLEFTDCSEEGMKTKKFIVKNKVNGVHLGVIKWGGAWRQYVYEDVAFGEGTVVLAEGCLIEIANKIRELRKEREDVQKN